jgi:hypothetical protein
MTRANRFGIIAVLTAATVVGPVFAGNVTVGRFYSQLAQANHFVAVDAASAEAGLRGAGINLPRLALDKSLTEGDMTAISKALGVTVKTERPSRLVSEAQLNNFVAIFGSRVGKAPGVGAPLETNDLPPQSGRGKKKGHSKHSEEPR